MQMRRFGNPDSAGSQFIICMGDMREELDGHFAAFGKVLGCRYSGVGFRVLGFRT
jgi:cyclophilin family peptidyl-prolyl cis-trans isomerase